MQESTFRYHPEFVVRVLVDGQDAGDAVTVAPSPGTLRTMRNYGLRTRALPGGLLAFVRQDHDGSSWNPAVDLDQPTLFSFRLALAQGPDAPALDFFSSGTRTFGRAIFYANNLAGGGAIDGNLSGGVVTLTAGSQAGAADRGALSTALLSVDVPAGQYTQIEAGRIRAGAPVSFSVSASIAPAETSAALDFRPLPEGAYVVRLQGTSPVQERVVVDDAAAAARLSGVVDIFRDAWLVASQPREYRIDFAST